MIAADDKWPLYRPPYRQADVVDALQKLREGQIVSGRHYDGWWHTAFGENMCRHLCKVGWARMFLPGARILITEEGLAQLKKLGM